MGQLSLPAAPSACPDPKCQEYGCVRARRRAGLRRMDVVTAIIAKRDGRVLMAQRHDGKQCPLDWEWPGGKVEPHEVRHELDGDGWLRRALARECLEELGVHVHVREQVSLQELFIDVHLVVHLFNVVILDGAEPQPLEAERLDWVAPYEAVKARSCTPITYVAHEDVVLWLERHKDDQYLEGWNT